MTLGERLKACRIKKRYTQKYVADKVGVRNNSLSMYENDQFEPSVDVLKKLADLYEVTVDYLIGRSHTPHLTSEQELKIDEKTRKAMEKYEQLTEENKKLFEMMLDKILKGQ
jgi:transcriptional regulator with XRE-family HTH domain